MTKKILLPLIIICLFSNCALRTTTSDKNKTKVLHNLEILNISFDAGYPDKNEMNWKPVTIPFIHKLPKPYFKNKSSFWIRGEFVVENPGQFRYFDYYAIDPGQIAADVVIFINRVQINEPSSDIMRKQLRPGSYVIPSFVNLKGKNKVYLHYIITGQKHVTFLSDFKIQNQAEYNNSQTWYTILYTQIPAGFTILLIAMFIILLRNYFHLKIKRYFIYALLLFIISLFTTLIFSPLNFPDHSISIALVNSLFPLNILFAVLIIQSISGKYHLRKHILLSSILIPLSVLVFLTALFLHDIFYYLQSAYNIVCLIFFISWVIYVIYYLKLLNSERFILNLIIAFTILYVIFYFFNIICITYNIRYQYFYYIFSTPLFAIPVIIFETRDAAKRRIEYQRIYKILYREKSLTESAENKIKRIIEFIHGNYTSDISREELASSVDMNHNYMSRLFYRHTGKKVNEYINDLRIKEAAELLIKPDNKIKIIDIALKVGFENISTFNRIFKNITGLSPTEFQRKNN